MSVTYTKHPKIGLEGMQKYLVDKRKRLSVVYLTRLKGELVALVPFEDKNSFEKNLYVWVWLDSPRVSTDDVSQSCGYTSREPWEPTELAKTVVNGDWIIADVDITVKIRGDYLK